jgi:hypothetical protein
MILMESFEDWKRYLKGLTLQKVIVLLYSTIYFKHGSCRNIKIIMVYQMHWLVGFLPLILVYFEYLFNHFSFFEYKTTIKDTMTEKTAHILQHIQ